MGSRNVLTLMASLSLTEATVTCQLDLFQGRELEPGWTLTRVETRVADTGVSQGPNPGETLEFECTGEGVDVEWVHPASGTSDPLLTVTLTGDLEASQCLNFRLFIDSIQLVGPIFGDWRDAFGS